MLFVALLVISLAFGLGAWLGAPYLPVLSRDVDSLLELSDLSPGQLLLDLGCGDGRLLKAAAKRGIRGIGYEINPLLWLVACINLWPYRQLVSLHLSNYWAVKLPPADAIYVFLIGRYMPKLDAKLRAEIKRPTRVVSYVFAIPNLKPVATTKNSFVYIYPKSSK